MKSVKPSPFGERFLEAFGNKAKAEIAKLLGVGNSTITDYVSGRIPPGETLIAISEITQCSVHWLLTGEGPMTRDALKDMSDIDLNEMMKEAVIKHMLMQAHQLINSEEEGNESTGQKRKAKKV